MTLAKTGYTTKTVERFQMDAAVVYTNFAWDDLAATGSGDLLGATAGGVTYAVEMTWRQLEVDGVRHMKMEGLDFLESANATITTQNKEFTAELIKRAINGTVRAVGADEGPVGYKVIETKRYVESTDYINNVAVIGKLSKTGEMAIFVMDKAFVTNGLEAPTEDNSETVVEQVFEARATAEQVQNDDFPWRIILPATVTV